MIDTHNLTIDKVNDYNTILEYLLKYNDAFKPNLTSICNIQSWAKKLSLNANNFIYKDKYNQNVVGMIFFYINEKTKIGYLTLILVDRKYIRQGIGTFLLNEFETFSKNCGMKELKLEVYKKNMNALKFYIKQGFRIFEEKKESYYMIKNIEMN